MLYPQCLEQVWHRLSKHLLNKQEVNWREKLKSEGLGHDVGMSDLWMLLRTKQGGHGDVGEKLCGARQTWFTF